MKLFFILIFSLSLLTGCGDDEASDEVRKKATPTNKPAPVAVKFDRFSIDTMLRKIIVLKVDDHAGMQQVVRNNAAGFCTDGKLGVGINQLPVETKASQSRQEQSKSFAMKDALQDAMAPLEGRYKAQQVKEIYAGILRWNNQVYFRTIVMGCFLKVPTGENVAQSG
ncbi:MAG: hypothetical protein HN478_02885 [Rhodospirillaceae bacterium]|jgi:hypothetical protein|nr:hypothetical protein [Rhodospirillaceae bacterium]MBT4689004.1 hypothetical protein [Rhodospirillaceae bacterium]MBT5894665.1 hypothetical protein [Rhodospirillaceae bacterium]MBT6427840.1 hypothetical protein [Rhodospirillaceae bacterium]MBT7759961.1 hypothetical protein [Rhodospirillaceae bacterium]